ncbi:SRPBCC family protein [Paradevosia shaoguanensis]|uniref:SRPBCC family protein n=1 Tax=Paradevosia shaoguanensis TaxID=1335043 RepID=UPI003C77B2F6
MRISPSDAIGATARRVEDRERDGQKVVVVIASRTYPTTLDDLWDALTSKERIARWFMPISGDLQLGGHYQLHGNAGGTVTVCDPPEKLALTWEFAGQTSWVDVFLQPDPQGGTSLTLEHSAVVDKGFWDQYGPGATGVGWDLGFMGLGMHIKAPNNPLPDDYDTWTATPDAADFVRKLSDDWGAASIAYGTDREKALVAAERTRQFYRGETPPDQAG